jgi:hypothetical protein
LLVLAAAAIPDGDANDKAYFRTVVQNQLDALGDYVTRVANPGGVAEALGWEGSAIYDDTGVLTGKYTSLWRLSYTVFAIDFAAQQSLWTMGNSLEFVRRAVRSQIGFITNGRTSGEKVPSYPVFGVATNGGRTLSFFSTWTDLFVANTTYPFRGASAVPGWDQAFGVTPVGYHGVEAHVLLSAGRRLGVPGVEAAYQWLLNYSDSYGSIKSDLNARSGYALDYRAAGSLAPARNVIVK